MTQIEFVRRMERYAVRDSAEVLDPEAASWYSSLPEKDRKAVESMMLYCGYAALWSLFTVLDNVRIIEESSDKGFFQLEYRRGEETVQLNGPGVEELHVLLDVWNK
jgi:hypothetical protein